MQTGPAGWNVPQQMMTAYPAPIYQGAGNPGAAGLVQQPPPQPVVQHAPQPPKRERHPLAIVDPNTQKNVIEEEQKRKKLEEYSKESTSSSSSAAVPAGYQYQQTLPQQQQGPNSSNYSNQNVLSSKTGDDNTSSQSNSRGQTPLSRSLTPTDAQQPNYSPGPPAAPNIGGKSSSYGSNTQNAAGQPNEQVKHRVYGFIFLILFF